jgi:hypothetical protein
LAGGLEDRGKVVQNQGSFPMALAANTTIGSQGLPVEFLRFVELAKAIKDGRQRDPVGSNSSAIRASYFRAETQRFSRVLLAGTELAARMFKTA